MIKKTKLALAAAFGFWGLFTTLYDGGRLAVFINGVATGVALVLAYLVIRFHQGEVD